MENILKVLNDKQIEAVTSTEGFIRIIAGAGSGKTKALTHRYAFIVRDLGVPPENVLCVTFTNKAAGEMRSRVRSLIGEGYDTSLITTYHGFCVRVLRESISKLFYPESFLILDKQDQKSILEEIYEELEIKLDKSTFERILGKIDVYKKDLNYVSKMITTEPFTDYYSDDLDECIIEKYLQRQKKIFALDFNDLINFTFVLFDRYPEVRNLWQKRLLYIQVDEFQDSSSRELKLIDILSSLHGNLFVVGDPDQNIYEWRGAKAEILVDFDKNHLNTKTVLMEQNYRSTPQILEVANSLIEKNTIRIKKTLFTNNPTGPKVKFLHLKTEREEADYIASEIERLKKSGYSYKDITVLYRSNYLSRAIEQGLYSKEIPYTIYGGVRFFDRMEIKDALSYLRLIVSQDDLSLLRVINVPKRRFGKASETLLKQYSLLHNLSCWESLLSLLEKGEFEHSDVKNFVQVIERIKNDYMAGGIEKNPISQLFSRVLEETGYEKYIRENGDMERLENLAELKKNITDFEHLYQDSATPERYLQLASLYAGEDDIKDSDTVKLMTVHTSKGLEFSVVFLCGLSDGIFPSSRSVEERKIAALEEERRLFFVGITRARYELYLTDSEGFTNRGKVKTSSRFLYDIDPKFIDGSEKLPKRGSISNSRNFSPSSRYHVGDQVVHGFFGIGEIRAADDDKQVYSVFFEKLGQERPISYEYSWKSVDVKPVSIPESPKNKEKNDNTISVENEFQIIQPSDIRFGSEPVALNSDIEKEKNEKRPIEKKVSEMINRWKDPVYPKQDWVCKGISDLGVPMKTCEMCGEQSIRFVHHMVHPSGLSLDTGCVCAGRLEGNEDGARTRENSFKLKMTRKKTFLSRTWKNTKKNSYFLKVKNKNITIYSDKFNPGTWCIAFDGLFFNNIQSFDKAKEVAFELIEKDGTDMN